MAQHKWDTYPRPIYSGRVTEGLREMIDTTENLLKDNNPGYDPYRDKFVDMIDNTPYSERRFEYDPIAQMGMVNAGYQRQEDDDNLFLDYNKIMKDDAAETVSQLLGDYYARLLSNNHFRGE